MLLSPKGKLLFIGDSITDCGRERPVGEGYGLGDGYVGLVNALLNSTYPQEFIRVLNVGTSGNTIRDLDARWQTDVFDLKPDWLSIMIGINDVWRQFDSPTRIDWHISLDEYESTLERLVQKTRPQLTGLILMTLYFIETNRSEPMRAMMDQYGQVVAHLAEKHGAVFVDTQAAFDDALRSVHNMSLAGDRIHPSLSGHMILARAFLDAVEYKWHPNS